MIVEGRGINPARHTKANEEGSWAPSDACGFCLSLVSDKEECDSF